MKIKLSHPEATKRERSGPRYWRSLDDLAQSTGFKEWLHREFPQGASELESGVDRRHFVKIMAASFGLAGLGLSGCRRQERKILPYNKQPEHVIPGVPLYYASSIPGAWEHEPAIVETHEARPTKIEGNPSYQPYSGGSSLFAQASVLDLYDPDRSQKPLHADNAISVAQAKDRLADWRQDLRTTQGAGVAILAEPSSSPTRRRLVDQLLKAYPKLLWVEHTAIDHSAPERALKALSGQHLRPHYQLEKAKRILAIGSDFLHAEPGHMGYAKAFAKTRRVEAPEMAREMSRLYAVEADMTITGGMADHRLRIPASQQYAFTAHIAHEVLVLTDEKDTELLRFLKQEAAALKVNPKWITACVEDLIEFKGSALVIAGADLPEPIQGLVALINEALQAPGHTLNYLEAPTSQGGSMAQLKKAIEANQVQKLMVLGGNPVYTESGTFGFASLCGRLKELVHLGYYCDETAAVADLHLPQTHFLESWGDGRAWDGTVLPVQPMIEPLFEGFDELGVLSALLGDSKASGYEAVRQTFKELSGSEAEADYHAFLTQGYLKHTAYQAQPLSVDKATWLSRLRETKQETPRLSESALELRFVPSNNVWDGRYSNNGWLQECPEPVTKLTWDNAILMSPALAKKHGLLPEPSLMSKSGQLSANPNAFKTGKQEARLAELSVGSTRIVAPVFVQPGLADYSLVLPLGYGRKRVGHVGTGTGFDFYPLRKGASASFVANAKIDILKTTYPLANTQEHGSMEGRAIIREANKDDYLKHPDFAQKMGMESHSPPVYGKDRLMSPSEKAKNVPQGASLYKSPGFEGPQQWGMVIDLNTCMGCNACVVACQSENNIPIIGKEQVRRGREMHWIRMDRYYSSVFDDQDHVDKAQVPHDPQVTFQPMMCMHCELAPCENVCPVNATVHDEQGLNTMAYNRCVGTRYCANNCPYKVRRFNFFDFNKRHIDSFYKGPLGPAGKPEITKMQKNPDVTIRMRGVMEKCTFCVQRIEEAKIRQLRIAKNSNNIKVPDGAIKTACQQVCPTESITFGDVADPTTKVSLLKESILNYSVLGYLGIRPRLTYLARVRNPNARMPDYKKMPLSRLEYEAKFGHH